MPEWKRLVVVVLVFAALGAAGALAALAWAIHVAAGALLALAGLR